MGSKMYENGRLETADVKTVHRLMQSILQVLEVKPKTMPIIALARAANDCPESLSKGDAETLTDGTTCIVPKIRISPAITGDIRAVVNALAHNAVHLALMAEGADFPKGTKHPFAFKEKAENLGLVCELKADDPHRNYLYSNVRVTDDQYRDILALTGEVKFNFEAIEKVSPKKNKKNSFVYVHPNMMDYVTADNGNLILFAQHNGQTVPMLLDRNGTLLQAVRENRRTQKRTSPQPAARQKTLA